MAAVAFAQHHTGHRFIGWNLEFPKPIEVNPVDSSIPELNIVASHESNGYTDVANQCGGVWICTTASSKPSQVRDM
jgi:predicted TIM-barrel fold metal-dependent hydrolase